MFDYTLAKQLKDAGFPQIHRELIEPGKGFIEYHSEDDWAYIPTLPELIDACGYDFVSLERHNTEGNIWSCLGDKGFGVLGSTSEEAVAKLWLALHAQAD